MLDETVRSAAAPVVAVDSPKTSTDWRACSMLALERLPLPYPVIVVLVGLFAAGEQILEHVTAPAYQYPEGEALRQGAVIVVLFLYILIYLGLLKRRAVIGLEKLRPAIEIGDQEYMQYARRMLNANPRFEVALFGVSVVVNYLLFIVAGVDPQMRTDGGMPDAVLLAAIFMSVYILLGWLLLTLVYTSIRFARGLGGLARKPLEVNVFDPGNLVPFGELSLLHSLAAVGLVLIPLYFLGPPESAGFIFIGLSVISLGALFVPLLGVHRQMGVAKEQALDQIYAQLMDGHRRLMECSSCVEREALDDLANRTALLANLRELVLKSPAWPFRDIAALLRAIIAVASPFLIYFLQRLMDVFVLPRFGP
jgi:hypothetical protein